MGRIWLKACAAALLMALLAPAASALRVKDLARIQGAEENALKGIGLVVGLGGTGDGAAAALRAQQRMLDRLEIDVDSAAELESDNVAVVIVTATYPPFAKAGSQMDVQVSSLYDAESLAGGTLLQTLLYAADDEVYGLAQGPVSVGGFGADAGGAAVRVNHLTVGRVPNGGTIVREIPSRITDGDRVTLILKKPDFTMASRVQEAINGALGDGAARAFNASTINVRIPERFAGNLVGFMAKVEDVAVEPAPVSARVIINERTGTVVVGGEVRVMPCQVAHGNLSILIASTPVISQPPPFSEAGETVATEVEAVEVTEEEARLMPVGGASAAEVAEALNKLKVTPRDLIAIFQALREAGALRADVEIM